MGSNLNMTRTPDVPLHLRGAARRREVRRHLARLQPGRRSTPTGGCRVEAGPGRGLLDGRQPRHPEGVPRRPPGRRTSRTTSSGTPTRPFLVELDAEPAAATRRAAAARQPRSTATRTSRTATGSCSSSTQTADEPRMPQGSVGFRWEDEPTGQVEPQARGRRSTTRRSTPSSTFLGTAGAEIAQVAFHEFAADETRLRGVPVRRRARPPTDARSPVATVFDLLMAQFGVGRGLAGDYPTSYDDIGAVHAGLAGAVHRHRPRHGDPVRARVRRQRRGDRTGSR